MLDMAELPRSSEDNKELSGHLFVVNALGCAGTTAFSCSLHLPSAHLFWLGPSSSLRDR